MGLRYRNMTQENSLKGCIKKHMHQIFSCPPPGYCSPSSEYSGLFSDRNDVREYRNCEINVKECKNLGILEIPGGTAHLHII